MKLLKKEKLGRFLILRKKKLWKLVTYERHLNQHNYQYCRLSNKRRNNNKRWYHNIYFTLVVKPQKRIALDYCRRKRDCQTSLAYLMKVLLRQQLIARKFPLLWRMTTKSCSKETKKLTGNLITK